MHSYLWLDQTNSAAPALLGARVRHLLGRGHIRRRLKRHPLIFLCIGSPKVPGDCLGPLTGSLLRRRIPYTVYGTLSCPVHALNLKDTVKAIRRRHPGAVIVAIDAAMGVGEQNGFLTIKKGPLRPGLGLGKRLPPVGHIQITGVFRNLYAPEAGRQMARYSLCIAEGLEALGRFRRS